ncbi:type VI secretion system baseplate subunit TssF [Archangium lansingense]|uniref:type VI secretion system baseplate subunit TssF n=1 Tax=Archangium lansingense TaxID=2995310 RepID=UPI003B795910
MQMDDTLYKAFLEELQTLEKFRMSYTALHPAAPLDREDQDVRRIIEALALFSTRTRQAGQRAQARGTMRLFQQHFSYLLDPVPAMAMLRAVPDARFVDATELPRGTPLLLNPGSASAPTGPLTFQTQASLRLLPISLSQVRVEQRGAESCRLRLTFESGFPRNDEPGALRLYINHLNDFRSSLAMFHHLKHGVRAASVLFDERGAEVAVGPAGGARGPVRFGAPRLSASEAEPFEHPLQRVRSFIHFPQQELFLEVQVPPPPRNWRGFTLCLELAGRWPLELVLTPETFVLHAVPVVNLQRGMSNPIEHDGTRERHGIQHPEVSSGYRVHSVLGVYQMESQGMVPLRPGAISGGPGTYELENEGQGGARKTWLSLELPGAFMKPARVAVEASWHQPLPAQFDASGYRAVLAERSLEGVQWSLVGAVKPGIDNPLEHSQQALLQLLSLRTQRFLGLEELVFLLETLGVREQRYFRELVRHFTSVKVQSKPFARSAAGFKYIYQLALSDLDATLLPTVDLFLERLLDLLGAWSTEDVIELEARLSRVEKPLRLSRS